MLLRALRSLDERRTVSIAGAILWGVLRPILARHYPEVPVSIAGAILWGVLRNPAREIHRGFVCFNRRGDSLGGAAWLSVSRLPGLLRFQSQGRFFGGCCPVITTASEVYQIVSIAGAILWGVLHKLRRANCAR